MALDAKFYEAVEPLFEPGMGTEHVGPLLYSLVRMTRPRNVLEVGLGYTSPFLAQALKDNAEEFAADKEILASRPDDDARRSLLIGEHFEAEYNPTVHSIDDFSGEGSTAPKVLEVARTLGLDSMMRTHEGDFRGYGAKLDAAALPLDFVWFDAGGPLEYIDFLREYWPLINPEHGHLVLHYTYWYVAGEYQGRDYTSLLCGSIANEIKRQQLRTGFNCRFEVLSLVEPHKARQGSVTLIRRLSPTSMCRDGDFQEEMVEIYGAKPPPMPRL